jgi:hypothetical protein
MPFMKVQFIKILLIVGILPVSFSVSAQSLERGFTALNAGYYPIARHEFQKILEKDSLNPPGNYGMAILYFEGDFDNKNTDSANYFVLRGIRSMNRNFKPTEIIKFKEFGAREFNFHDLQSRINESAFAHADSLNLVDSWDHFIKTYVTSPQLDMAVEKRNERAYNDAKGKFDYQSFEDYMKKYPNSAQAAEARKEYDFLLYRSSTKDSTYESYKAFMDKYPQSPYYNDAKAQYEKLLYQSLTSDHKLAEYVYFVAKYPDNKYIPMAQDSVYVIFTRANTVSILRSFIQQCPDNPHINEAWLRLYNMSIPIFSKKAIQNFASANPQFPDKTLLQHDLKLARRSMKRIQIDSLYGYEDSVICDTFIKPQFTQADEFSEGYAVVSTGKCTQDTSGNMVDCIYGYINAEGKYAIQPRFSQAYDFKNGIALVSDSVCKDTACRFGFINRFGDWVIKPIYSDAYEFNSDRALVKVNGKGYGYLNRSGEMSIYPHFEDALSFSMGIAGVKQARKWGFIDTSGSFIIDPKFPEVGVFSEGFAAASDSSGKWGYIDQSGAWIIKPQFTSANPFQGGKATVMVEKAVRVKGSKNRVQLGGERIIDTTGKFIDVKSTTTKPHQ